MKPIRVSVASNGDYWQAWWIDRSGQRKRRSLGSKADLSERQAKEAAALIQAEVNASDRGSMPERLTLSKWREEFMVLRAGELKPRTRELYGMSFDLLEKHLGPQRRLASLTPADAARWRAWLVDDRGLSPATVAGHVRHAKHLLAWAVKMGHLRTNPLGLLKGSAPVRGAKAYVDMVTFGRLVATAPDAHWRRALALCRLAGLRYGEMQRLHREDISGSVLTIRPDGGVDGTKQRYRLVPITPELAPYLEGIGGGQVCLGMPADVRLAHNALLSIIRKAGVQRYPKPFHSLRASCESDWLTRFPVMDVCRWLGHDPSVAMRHYQETTPETWARATGVQQ